MNKRAKDNPNRIHRATDDPQPHRLPGLLKGHPGRAVVVLLVSFATAGAFAASARIISRQYTANLQTISMNMVATAQQLQAVNTRINVPVGEADALLTQMKILVEQYEQALAFAGSPYPGEIYIGTTGSGDSRWLDLLATTRYTGFFREIRIRRTGSFANYVRINDIEIIHNTRRGTVTETFNVNGRFKLYQNNVFRLSLPQPMRVDRMRIRIDHESAGLEVYGVPYEGVVEDPRVPVKEYPGEILLGTTPAGDSNWLETLCSGAVNPPVRQLRLRRTGQIDSYIRIREIEVTCLTRRGTETHLLNTTGRDKLYFNDVFTLPLPIAMKVVRVRIHIDHESTGLEVYGVY